MQGPRLYRFFNYEMPLYIPAPTGGWNPDANPWELPVDQAYQLDNFLFRPGKIVNRGGILLGSDTGIGNRPLQAVGVILNPVECYIARRSGGSVDPWNAPLLRLLSSQSNFLGSGSLNGVYPSSLASTGTVQTLPFASTDAIPGPRWINFNGLMYGLSYDCVASPVLDTGGSYIMKPINLLQRNIFNISTNQLVGATAVDSAAIGTVAWSNPTNVLLNNPATPATAAMTLGAISHRLQVTGFGFAIPSNSTVIKINVTLGRTTTAGLIKDNEVCLKKAGVIQNAAGQNLANAGDWPTGTSNPAYGSAQGAPLWNNTWTPSDINNANFGVSLSVTGDGTDTAGYFFVGVVVTYVGATTVCTGAPHGASDLIGYQSRIWMVGGVDTPGSGTLYNPVALAFTNPAGTPGPAAAPWNGGISSSDWQDPVSAASNVITMDGESTDFGVGLGKVRNGLVIFRRSSVWLLKGSTTANYALVPISKEVGCVDPRSIVQSDRGVYFMSERGLMLTNGTVVANVSGTIEHTLREAIRYEQQAILQAPSAGTSGWVTCESTTQGHLIVSIGILQANGSVAPILSALYDPEASKGGSWVRLTSALWNQNIFGANTGDSTNLAAGTMYCPPLYSFGVPRRLISIGDRFVCVMQDKTNDIIDMLDPQLGIVDGSNFPIPLVWTTHMPAITVATKRTIGQGKRFWLDYQAALPAGFPLGYFWTVTPFDGNGTAMASGMQCVTTPAQLTAGANLIAQQWVAGTTNMSTKAIQRANQDFYQEITQDVMFRIANPTFAADYSPHVLEIYGMGIEFQRSRESRNLGQS